MNKPLSHEDTELVRLDPLTKQVIGCAIEVHRTLEPGLPESLDESALCIEFDERGITRQRQVRVPAYYKGRLLGSYRVDLVVADAVIIEVKSVRQLTPVDEAQLITYLRLTDKRVGLLFNFNCRLLKDGMMRRVL